MYDDLCCCWTQTTTNSPGGVRQRYSANKQEPTAHQRRVSPWHVFVLHKMISEMCDNKGPKSKTIYSLSTPYSTPLTNPFQLHTSYAKCLAAVYSNRTCSKAERQVNTVLANVVALLADKWMWTFPTQPDSIMVWVGWISRHRALTVNTEYCRSNETIIWKFNCCCLYLQCFL